MSHESRIYGHIPNVPFGTLFRNREELLRAGVHAQNQAGIHGDSKDGGGAFSICLSGGYEDNQDNGDKIIYVGSGGQNSRGEQVADQSFEDPRNKSLEISRDTRRPVRVIRGKNKESFYAPSSGYRYDGLYLVDSAEMRPGKQGYQMCFFELRRMKEEGDGPIPTRRRLTAQRLNNMLKQARRK